MNVETHISVSTHYNLENDFSTQTVKVRKATYERQRTESIITSIVCIEMYGLKKKTIEIVALCQTFNWANAPSYKPKDRTNYWLPFCRTEDYNMRKTIAMDVMRLYEIVKWWGRHVWIEDKKDHCQFTQFLSWESNEGWVGTVSCLKSIPSRAFSCVLKTPSPIPRTADIRSRYTVPSVSLVWRVVTGHCKV